MNKNDILKKLEVIISDVLNNESIKLEECSIASDIDGWDSLNHLRIILSIEESFNVEFEIDDISLFENVGDIILKICEQKGL